MAQGESREFSIPVTGLSCAGCVKRAEVALERVEHVHSAEVNLASEKATIRGDESLSANAIAEALKKCWLPHAK